MGKKFLINDNNVRLDRYIKTNILNNIPQSLLEKHLRKKLIKLEGSKVKSNARVKKGQILSIDHSISFNLPAKNLKHHVDKHHIKYDILYQDQYIIVINKPNGIAVQGGTNINISICDLLNNFDKVDNEIPKIVHRLDKDTSGALCIARTLKTTRFLGNLFQSRKIKKVYRAIVEGKLNLNNDKIELPLSNKCIGGQDIVCVDSKNGQKAITYFKVLKYIPQYNCSYIELQPITGRKHQLRAHMRHIGHPIHGDAKYNSSHPGKLCLHSYTIELVLPNSKKVTVKAAIPAHIEKIVQTEE